MRAERCCLLDRCEYLCEARKACVSHFCGCKAQSRREALTARSGRVQLLKGLGAKLVLARKTNFQETSVQEFLDIARR